MSITEALGIAAVVSGDPHDVPDPLEPDAPDDAIVVTSRRRLARLAVVAAETGARFQRDALEADAVVWLSAPQPVFDGQVAIDVAQEREYCLRAVLLHGLGAPLDRPSWPPPWSDTPAPRRRGRARATAAGRRAGSSR